MRNFKKFMKKKFHKKDGYDKKKPNHRRCYECKELGHYIADCPKLKNKEKEERKYKEKSKDNVKKICYNCGKYGHRSYDCLEPSKLNKK